MTHEVKILPKYFNAVVMGTKNFELRKNDRLYSVGDTLVLREWDGENYTGNTCERTVSYVFKGTGEYGLDVGYCVLGLKNGAPIRLDEGLYGSN